MKFLHAMIRVKNLEESIKFYTDILGMKLIRKKDYPEGKFTLAFVGYDENQALIELTFNWDGRNYEMGDAFGHLAIGVDDIYDFCDKVKSKGGKVVREPGPMKSGTTVIAFVEDPDGYKIEILNEK